MCYRSTDFLARLSNSRHTESNHLQTPNLKYLNNKQEYAAPDSKYPNNKQKFVAPNLKYSKKKQNFVTYKTEDKHIGGSTLRQVHFGRIWKVLLMYISAQRYV